ncbi:hypothetical protein LzC2_41370 [Planctomycetes bacterium LzC2]|uniref:Uncharacterized protein n=1 Tax=Alienimonas chondri TaxID=2681879 RepID=A0ABX1VL42_9PLAN|nr:hypothetical protein [Alienimonas chondri]
MLVFGPGSVTPQQWRDFREVPFGDLVLEEEPEPLSLAGSFESDPPKTDSASEPAGRINPRRTADESRADNGAGSRSAADDALVTPTLTLPAGDPVTSLPAAPSNPAKDPVYSLAAPADGFGASGFGANGDRGPLRGEGQTVVDVTDMYDSGPNEVALLPAPGASPYYGDAMPGNGSSLANDDSHLMALEDYPEMPGLGALSPGISG